VIDVILEGDKQHHMVKRIFERLRAEHA